MANSEQWEKQDTCSNCAVAFSTFNRRHHCRKCCKSFCSAHIAIRRPDLAEEKAAKMCVPCMLTMPAVKLPGVEKTNKPQRVLIPLPNCDFDPTETAVPWRYLKAAGHTVVFATPNGSQGAADPYMLTGDGLYLLSSILRADQNGCEAYEEMEHSEEFNHPLTYDDIDPAQFDALLLPGGHAKGMREYLESALLQSVVVDFFSRGAPVAAICHGVLLAARSMDPSTGKSVLYERNTTGLRKDQEMAAWQMTRVFLQDYYRTYETPLETELRTFLRYEDDQYQAGGAFPMLRDSPTNITAGFTVQDKNYLSARWPGDAHKFALNFLALLEEFSGNAALVTKGRSSFV